MHRPLYSLLFALALGQANAQPSFKEQLIDDKVQIGYGAALADVNGDGKTDILLADKRAFVWYENPGWQRHVMAQNLTPKDNVCIAARDIDGDGKCEVAVGGEWNPSDTTASGAVFYLQPPADRRQEWSAIKLHHEPTVHRMRWVRGLDGNFSLFVLPLHGRDNKGGEGTGVKLLAYQRPADPTGSWTVSTVIDSMHQTHNFDLVPAIGNDPESVVIGGREGIVRVWPTLDGWHQQWIAKHDDPSLKGAGEVRWGFLGNGSPYVATIEPMHGHQLCLYTPAPDGPKDKPWQRRILDETLVDGHALGCMDLLGMNNRQIVVGWRSQQKIGPKVGVKILWTSKEDGSGWEQALIDDNGMACEDLVIGDLDGDKDPEIIAAGRRTQNLKIYWNQRIP
jgi:FG-GAP-like repeat